jgi:hypothetical protein
LLQNQTNKKKKKGGVEGGEKDPVWACYGRALIIHLKTNSKTAEKEF